MKHFRLSAMISNFRVDHWQGIRLAAELGLEGVHVSVGKPPLHADAMDAAARKKLRDYIQAQGLEVSALSSWGGQVDLGDAEKQSANVADAAKTLALAVDLGTRIWQAHIGVMPRNTADPRWQVFVDSVGQIAARGEELGACLAIETGPEPPAVVKRLIETVGSPAIRVNYDPANLILWPPNIAKRENRAFDLAAALQEYTPVDGVSALAPYIVHVHAKDAVAYADGTRREVPLGQGLVDWPRFMSLLETAGYDGYIAIERETGGDPTADIRQAVQFLRSVEW